MIKLELGFIVFYEGSTKKFTKQDQEEGHQEIANRIIKELALEEKYKKSRWAKLKDPVDFLVYDEGAVKLGHRWDDYDIICYCYDTITAPVFSAIQYYRNLGIRVEKLSYPKF